MSSIRYMMAAYGVPTHSIDWQSLIPEEHWRAYRCVLHGAVRARIPFALGGGLAVGVYTGNSRYTKDVDLYILPQHRSEVTALVTGCGLSDYFDVKPYDREWIYRSHNGEIIVDAIWAMANQRACVDEDWLVRGPFVRMFDEEFRVVPAEELIWSKIYVLQRDRCDWPDILNLINATGPALNWNHLLDRAAQDIPLIRGVMSVFAWVSPERAAELPPEIWRTLNLPEPENPSDGVANAHRPNLLDTRPWFQENFDSSKAA